MAANIHHPEVFVHFFLKVFENIIYDGQNRITLPYPVVFHASGVGTLVGHGSNEKFDDAGIKRIGMVELRVVMSTPEDRQFRA